MFGSTNTGFNFGQQPAATNAPAFGTTPSFSVPSSTAFGTVFGQTNTVATAPQQPSLFGSTVAQPAASQQPQQQTSGFGFNFSSPNTSTSAFGTGFNQTQQPTTATNQQSGFSLGSNTQSGFGFGTQQQQPGSSILVSQTSQPSLFGQPTQTTNTSSFLSSGGLFGTKTTTVPAATAPTTGFGNFGTSSFSLNLGTAQPAAAAATTQQQQSSIFRQPLSTSTFGSFATPTTNTSSNTAATGVLGAQPTNATGTFTSTFGSTSIAPAASTAALTSLGSTFSMPAQTSSSTTASAITFNFGTTSSITPATSNASMAAKPSQLPNFGSTTLQPGQTSIATTTTSIAPISSVPAATTASTLPSLNFGSLQTTGQNTTSAAVKPVFGISTTTATSSVQTSVSTTTISFSSITTSSTTAPSTTQQQPTSSISGTIKPNTGFIITSLGSTTSSSTTTTATSTAISGPVATTTATPGGGSIPPQITFGQLEDQINIWMNELSQFEADFHSQSQTINSWDSLLISNGQKLIEMNQMIEKLNMTHRGLDHQLDFIIAQQKELEQLLEQVEDNKLDLGTNNVNAEREHTYSLVETVHNDLNAIGSDLKDFIKKLNETKSNHHESSDPMIQILKILNSHMDVLQWMENQIKNIKVN